MFGNQSPYLMNQKFNPAPQLPIFQSRSPTNVSVAPTPVMQPQAQPQGEGGMGGLLGQIPGFLKDLKKDAEKTGEETPKETPWGDRQLGHAWDWVKGQFGFGPEPIMNGMMGGFELSESGMPNVQQAVQSAAGLGANNPGALATLTQGNPFLKAQNLQNGLFGILGQGLGGGMMG